MRTLTLYLLAACAGISAGYGQQASDSDAAAKIVVMEHIWNQAYALKDSKALEKILDDSFVKVESDGRLTTKADVLAEITASTLTRVVIQSMSVQLHGDTAIITGILLTNGVEKRKPFMRRERFVDTWLCRSGQWIALSSLVTPARP